MRRVRIVSVVLLALVALLSGCKRKKPPVPAPQEQAPTIIAPPPEIPLEPRPQIAEPTVLPPKKTAKRKVKLKTAGKTVPEKPQIPPPEPEKKTVVNEGSAPSNPQLAADLPAGEIMHQRQTTAQLQTATEADLRALTRSLSADEQAMVQQIHAYIQQSRAADASGDTERAYNLAFKARLLCTELIKR